MQLKVKKLSDEAQLPTRGSEQAAGLDLYSLIDATIPSIPRIIPTGIAIEIPEGYVGILKDRSGLVTKFGLHVLAGVIDSDYRGEVGVVLINEGSNLQTIHKGDRIAQLLVIPYMHADIIETQELGDTIRDAGGFGSTGI